MLANNYIWTFTTADVEPPPVFITAEGTNPLDGATGVCVNKSVSATFSEKIDPATIVSPAITFTLTEAMNPIYGEVALDASGTIATFTPLRSWILISNTPLRLPRCARFK